MEAAVRGCSVRRGRRGRVLLLAAGVALLAGCGGNESVATSIPTFTTEAPPSSAEATSSAPSSTQETRSPSSDGRDSYLKALSDRGVTYEADGEVAVGTATYICTALTEGVSQEEMMVLVTALVAQEGQLAGSQVAPDEAAGIYVEAAQAHYC